MPSSIDPFIHRKVVVLNDDTTVQQAAQAMCQNRVGSVLISNSAGKVTGILTDRDLVCGHIAPGLDEDTPLSEIVIEEIHTVGERSDISDVIGLMEEFGIRRVPIVEESKDFPKKVVGMITIDDLVAAQAVPYTTLAKVVKAQIARRRNPATREERAMTRTETSLSKFQSVVSRTTGFDQESSLRMAYFVLSSIVRRIHYTAAAHLISQLPRLIQPDLLDLPAGPDNSIDADSVVQGMTARFGISPERARTALGHFWEGLMEATGGGSELADVYDQLPPDMKELLRSPPAAGLKTMPHEERSRDQEPPASGTV